MIIEIKPNQFNSTGNSKKNLNHGTFKICDRWLFLQNQRTLRPFGSTLYCLSIVHLFHCIIKTYTTNTWLTRLKGFYYTFKCTKFTAEIYTHLYDFNKGRQLHSHCVSKITINFLKRGPSLQNVQIDYKA